MKTKSTVAVDKSSRNRRGKILAGPVCTAYGSQTAPVAGRNLPATPDPRGKQPVHSPDWWSYFRRPSVGAEGDYLRDYQHECDHSRGYDFPSQCAARG